MATTSASPDYARHKRRAAERQRRIAAAGRDIAPLPPVADPLRRRRAVASLADFLPTYFPAAFALPFCPDHVKIITKLDRAIRRGGLFALAMPRGSGKTTITERAAIWALLGGRRRFLSLIAATEKAAEEMLAHLKVELEHNDALAADFPEVCHPIRCLENNAKRCAGQTYRGQQTRITWTVKKLVLPTIPASPASGSIVTVAGLTGAIRGQNHTLPTGEILRPSLAILDDPQTTESAHSPAQSERRRETIAADVLAMAGPGRSIAAVMPCTVIAEGDLADQMLDRRIAPEWQGERTQLVYAWPEATKLWERYAEIRADSLNNDGDGSEATEFYRDHREEMDRGAVVAWPERYDRGKELSAIQHAYNLWLRDPAAFDAEFQNAPHPAATAGEVVMLPADEIARRLSGVPAGQVPDFCDFLTLFVDPQDALHYWIVCGWALDFTGAVVAYGTWPQQTRDYFTLRKPGRTLRRAYPGIGIEGAIARGLADLLADLFGRNWSRGDGAAVEIARGLVDFGYKPDEAAGVIAASAHRARLLGSRGQGIRAGSRPISDYDRKRGDRIGHNWWIPNPSGRKAGRHFRHDTNFWKSDIHRAIALPPGEPGSLTLPGTKATAHRLLADHLTAETATVTEGHGRRVDDWRLIPGRDNHWLDCLVGCAAAASLHGAQRYAAKKTTRRRRRRRKVSYMEG